MRNAADHVIIGGGLAGSMIAIHLAAAGRDVMLLEKQREPHHKVCGEFLSAEAVLYLQQVGINPLELGAHPIQRVRLHSSGRSARAPLPFTALSLSRRVLDEALLAEAETRGCELHRGAFVERLARDRNDFSVQLRGGQTIDTRAVFLATGKHDIAELPRGSGLQSDLVGFKMHLQLAPEQSESIRGTMDLFLFHGGYGGLALIERGLANLCFVVRQSRLRRLGGWTEMLSAIRQEVSALDSILQGAIQCWPKPLAIAPIPYGHLATSTDGIWLLGDQAAVIPSFTGDGMSIALHSAKLAADMHLAGKTPGEYLACLRNDLRSGMRFATYLSRLMVMPTARVLAPLALSAAPAAMSWIAMRTRIPNGALRRTSAAKHSAVPVA